MSELKPRPRSRHPVTWTVVTILLAAPFVALLWVPSYASTTPKAGGFPFFYWYQLVWVPGVAVLSVLAYLLVLRTRRGGTPPAAAPPAGGTHGGAGTGTGTGTTSGTEPTS
jgi:hypothetical protein